MEKGVQRQNRSKIASNFPFVLLSRETYFILSQTEATLLLVELTVNELKEEPRLSTCSNDEARRKAVEAISRCALWSKMLKKHFSDTCSMRKRAAHDLLMQAWVYHCLLNRWSGRTGRKHEARRHKANVVKERLLTMSETGNVVDMS